MTPGVVACTMDLRRQVQNAVYQAARDGSLKRLKVFLSRRDTDEVEELVSAKIHGATPLVMACRNGHYDVAEYLIKKCGADIEQPGSVYYDGETIEGVSPLWCAAAAGHLELVKLLVKKGANVNSTTKTKSTPLRAACFDGYIDIVTFLVQNGADIEMANRHGHTSLMIACFRGHITIVKFLLELKADVNRKTVKGNTALHDCAESGYLEILKILLAHGARMDVDSHGMTPLLAAAITGHTHIIEYLINSPGLVTRKECIDAYELLGATYVDRKRDMTGALEYWKKAAEERYRGNEPVITKPPQPSLVAAYDFAQEISDPDQLDELLANPDAMRMQALIIRERILGPAHPDTCYYIRYRGVLYADGGKFGRCIDLWNYALDVQQSMLEPLNPMTLSLLLSFTELFRFMIREKGRQTTRGRRIPPVRREELLRVFKKAVLEVKAGKQMCDKVPASEYDVTHLSEVLVTTLHLAYLLTRELPEEGTEEYIAIHKAIYELVRLNAKKRGRDALQLIHSQDIVLISRYYADKFPPLHLAKALLRVGADVTAKDNDGNTALHLTALLYPGRPDLQIALLEAGAHIDVVNNESKTFEMLLGDKTKYNSINPLKYTTLACLAARVVRRTQSISNVPKHLVSFILMH